MCLITLIGLCLREMDLLTPGPGAEDSKLSATIHNEKSILHCEPSHTYTYTHACVHKTKGTPKRGVKRIPNNTLHKCNALKYVLCYSIICQLISLMLFRIQNPDFATQYLVETHSLQTHTQFYTQCT